jgi:Transposase IS116/IS110/IS902 family
VARISELTAAIDDLARRIGELTETLAPSLLNLFGCGPLSAAKTVAETAGIERFRSQAAFAAHNGTAPITVWSGNAIRHRLNRGGNRQLNAALHRIAITQLRCASLGHAYVDKRLTAGDAKTEAIRALRRRLSDEVYRRLQADEAARPGLDGIMRGPLDTGGMNSVVPPTMLLATTVEPDFSCATVELLLAKPVVALRSCGSRRPTDLPPTPNKAA